MASINLIESFQDFKDAENIDRPTLMKVLEDVFKTLLRKKYGSDENFDVIVNTEKGDLEIVRPKSLEDGAVLDPLAEIAYSDAETGPIFEGEDLHEEVESRISVAGPYWLPNAGLSYPHLKKNSLVKKYGDRVGEIISAEVYQVWKKEVLLLDEDGNEIILPKSEQIPSDYFKKGENIRAVVKKVEMKNNSPVIVLSRTHPSPQNCWN
jgi:N utilization substance protein A